jgi:hypothetical protein
MAQKHRPGRKKRPCKANYNNAKRWILNKIRRIERHLKRCPNDAQSIQALDRAKSRA